MNKYEKNATLYCERYGIVDYKISGNELVYYANHPSSHPSERNITYKVTVDLDTNKTIERKELKRYYKWGQFNKYL